MPPTVWHGVVSSCCGLFSVHTQARSMTPRKHQDRTLQNERMRKLSPKGGKREGVEMVPAWAGGVSLPSTRHALRPGTCAQVKG